jgi:DNA-binding beta-propeller fold protein YncE
MKRILTTLVAGAVALTAGALSAQQAVPVLDFDSNATPLATPENIHLGEVAGVATNSRGDVYVYTRTGNPSMTIGTARAVVHGGSRLFQFDRSGKYVREIGQGAYGLLQAQQVRVDPQDNVWIVDQMSTQVIKFDPNGRIQMILSRKPEAVTVPNPRLDPLPAGVPVIQPEPGRGAGAAAGRGAPPAEGAGRAAGPAPLPGAGPTGETFNRPTDVAWDAQGNIYVADGYGNARIAKYDRNGKWIRNWGSRGSAQGQFNIVHGVAVDAQGNVYVADEGNKRIQVFDGDGTFKTQFTNVGTPTALCISRGPQQVLYVAHTGDPDGMEDAAIYKLDLNGTVLGKFGSAGKEVKQFGLVNSIDCRNPNELLVGELSNWRVQKLTLRVSR